MAVALCVSCKKVNNNDSTGGDNTEGNGTIAGHEYVDLGLPSGTLWATCNVGADSPVGYGNYYTWGETAAKSTYDWSNYKWCNGNYYNLTKYNTKSSYGIVDNKMVLDPEDDAARVNWGGDWRMPTSAEFKELYENTTSTWTTDNGVNGRRFTSMTNSSKYIFLPAAGYYNSDGLDGTGSNGNYWSSSLFVLNPSSADFLYFDSGDRGLNHTGRSFGYSVRPVCSPQN